MWALYFYQCNLEVDEKVRNAQMRADVHQLMQQQEQAAGASDPAVSRGDLLPLDLSDPMQRQAFDAGVRAGRAERKGPQS
jgi:hypothetical protein